MARKTYLVERDRYGTAEPIAIILASDKKEASKVFWDNMDEGTRESIEMEDWAPALGREPVTYVEIDAKRPFLFIAAVP